MEEKLTVIISTRNTLEYLKLAIKSLRENNKDTDFDLVIADDNSKDGTKEWLRNNRAKYVFSYTTHDNKNRKGIVGINEQSISDVKDGYVFLMHSDMYAGKYSLKNMLKYAGKGKVISATRIEPPIYPHEDCRIQMEFGTTDKDFKEEDFNDFVDKLLIANEGIYTDGVFAPTLFHKSDWIGYDIDFAPQSREDSDLFNRWMENGIKFIQPWDALVYHFSGKGSRRSKDSKKDTDEWKATEARNLKNYVRKWGTSPLHTSYMHPIIAPKVKLSLVTLLHNEEDLIYNLLDNIEPFFDDIIIVNDNSKDNSIIEINKYINTLPLKYKSKISIIDVTLEDKDFSKLRNIGIDNSKGDFIFHLDCDEIVDIYLLNELRFLAANALNSGVEVYGFSRLNTIDGENTGVWPDIQFRFHRKGIHWVNKVHEVPEPVVKAIPGQESNTILLTNLTIKHPKSSERQARQNTLYREMAGRKIDSVIIDSVIYTNEGITKHIRETAREFRRRGMNVQLLDLYKGDKFGKDMREMCIPVDITKDNYFALINQPPTRWPRSLGMKNFVGYFAFEGLLPDGYVEIMNNNNVREIWTPSSYCKDCFIKSGVTTPIKIIPHGIDIDVWKPNGKIEGLRDNKDQKLFLVAGTWHNDRKGIDLAVKAFNEEFKKDDNVKLILKINNIYNPGFDIDMKVASLINDKGNRNIEVIDEDYVPEEELNELFNSVDCYVAPHRSEGFGLFILQAMAAGCPVITTGATGNLDFCRNDKGEDLVSLIPITNKPFIPQRDEVYANAVWVEPDLKSLKKLMREVEKDKYPFDTKKASDYIRENYTWKKTVDKMVKEVGKF